MSSQPIKQKRKYDRFDTDVKVFFRVEYDIQTKVEYQVVGEEKKHTGVTKNVSTEGMCFVSNEKLHRGDRLAMDLYLPEDDNPVHMISEVRWSEVLKGDKNKYETGVKIITINSIDVSTSIFFDNDHNLYWSPVLESILGKFKIIQLNKKKSNKSRGKK